LLYDAVGSLAIDNAMLQVMREAGVELHAFRPPWPWKKKWGLNRRDHRKILSIDGSHGYVGGMNISDHHLPLEAGGSGWRDTHLYLSGPAAIQLQRLFVEEWLKQSGDRLPEDHMAGARQGGVPARVVENRQMLHRARVRASYFDALSHATERVWITNSYFAPDRRFVRALISAAKRGVHVHIIVAGLSDTPMVIWAGEVLYSRLFKAGVRISRWTQTVLHAKTAVVDGRWSTVGTYNLDQRSYRFNLEVNATVLGSTVAEQLEHRFLQDLAVCEEITKELWEQRGYLQRLRALVAFLFRRWL